MLPARRHATDRVLAVILPSGIAHVQLRSGEPAYELDLLRCLLEWFDRYLKGIEPAKV